MAADKPGGATRLRSQQGLVLLAVLVFILMTTLAASSLVVSYTTQLQREKEEQLLFAGAQIRRAITSYYNTVPPGGARSLPQSLEALLSDDRFPRPIQHLRRLYPDPMTGRPDWFLIREDGGIVGVRSQSAQPTIKKAGFGSGNEHLEKTDRYSDWTFALPRR
ncbi:type II secretion system protein [Ramlibacter sp.]|uniref:type II secretion system protein n=1 Tax=Ramlibacter sp. TaxID=1917967 RepID=UPI001854C8CA|nr:type II secretion system protein [Ramlibacter sp.]MBA2674825.1 type II secretion system protein [Ramlibacter sp.]